MFGTPKRKTIRTKERSIPSAPVIPCEARCLGTLISHNPKPLAWAVPSDEQSWAVWISIFPILNDKQRVATRWGWKPHKQPRLQEGGRLEHKGMKQITKKGVDLPFGFKKPQVFWQSLVVFFKPTEFFGSSGEGLPFLIGWFVVVIVVVNVFCNYNFF